MKDLNTREIYANMNDTLGVDWIGHSIATKYLREKSFSKSVLDTDFEPEIKEENFFDKAILRVLEESPSSSFRQIVKRTLIPVSTVRYDLANSLGCQIRNIR
jgi:hypothetical protein